MFFVKQNILTGGKRMAKKQFPESFWEKDDIKIEAGKLFLIPSALAEKAATFEALASQKGFKVSVLTRPCGAIEMLLY